MFQFKKLKISKYFFGAISAVVLTGFPIEIQAQNQKNSFAVQLAESVIKNNPNAWMTDFNDKPLWGYVQGLVCQSLQEVSKQTGNPKYFDYVKNTYTDLLIDDQGNVNGYKMESFKLDDVNSAKLLFSLYEKTKNERYSAAIEKFHEQLKKHPRISEGGYWHKKVYPNQMWLDGLYMGLPFYAQYATIYKDPEAFDDISNQLLLAQKHIKDSKTGLYYHGWDASKTVYWADPKTGLSKNFWGRGVGWLYMALVDVLEFLPENHKNREQLVTMYQELTDAIVKVQDKNSGVWYQVLDFPNREGNYLESTASSMFVYGLSKGIQLGVLDTSYLKPLKKGYKGILKSFIKISDDGLVEITSCCAGAGLGPANNPVRDGSYEYYIKEGKRSNDGKAIGPLIMTSLLIEKNPQWNIL